MTSSQIPDLTAPTTAPVTRAELLSTVRRTTEALARLDGSRLVQIAALCDAYADDPALPAGNDPAPHVLHGEQIVFPAADGTPGVTEFFHLELAIALGCSPESAQVWIADVLNLRHRHPVLWGHALAARIPVWVAREVTRCCLALDFNQARRFDAEHATAMTAWTPGRCQRFARERSAMLASGTEDTRQSALNNRQVTLAPSRTAGLTLLEADLDSLDAAHLDRCLDKIAEVLKLGGASETHGVLRAVALGHLAHPDRARHLLSDSLLDGGSVTPQGDVVTTDGEIVTADHQRCRHGAHLVLHLRASDLRADRGALAWSLPDGQSGTDEHGRRALGVLTQRHLRELLNGCPGTVTVRPVVDLTEPVVINQYRPHAELSWRIRIRDQQVMFPNSNRSAWSRGIDLDHTRPWPEGDTAQDNLGPLTRTIHRAKTHGGFHLTQESEGTFCWTTPTGQQAWVNAHGTWRTPPPSTLTDDPADTTVQLRRLLGDLGAPAVPPAVSPERDASDGGADIPTG